MSRTWFSLWSECCILPLPSATIVNYKHTIQNYRNVVFTISWIERGTEPIFIVGIAERRWYEWISVAGNFLSSTPFSYAFRTNKNYIEAGQIWS